MGLLFLFGDVWGGTTATVTVQVANAGCLPLEIEGVEVDVGVDDTSAVRAGTIGAVILPAGAQTTLALRFTPERPRSMVGDLLISSNDPDEPVHAVPLRGEGVGPSLALDVDRLDFGTVCVGCTSAALVTLENVRNVDLTVLTAELRTASGDLAVDWLEGEYGDLFTPLAPGEVRQAELLYAPSDVGPDEATLRIESDDPWAPALEVDVTGEGG